MSNTSIYNRPEAPRTASAIAPRHARVINGKVPEGRKAYWLHGYKTVVIPDGYEVCGSNDDGAEYACSLVYDGRGVEYGICRSHKTHSYRNLYIRRVRRSAHERLDAQNAAAAA